MNLPMTPEAYVAAQGLKCPNCRSTDVRMYPPEHEGSLIQVSCECDHCKATWQEQYTLQGYTELDASERSETGDQP